MIHKFQIFNDPSWDTLDLFEEGSVEYRSITIDDNSKDSINASFSIPTEVPYTTTNKTILGYTFEDSILKSNRKGYIARLLNSDDVTISEGVVIIDDITVNNIAPSYTLRYNDNVSKFVSELEQVNIGNIFEGTQWDNLHTVNDKFFNSYSSNDIELPYIDMCNDTEAESILIDRQYVTYGNKRNRFGLPPAIKAKYLVERCFAHLGYSVASEMFQINHTRASQTMDMGNLYYIFGTRLVSSEEVREFDLVPYTKGYSVNDNQYDSSGDPYVVPDAVRHTGTLWQKVDGSNNTPIKTAPVHYSPTTDSVNDTLDFVEVLKNEDGDDVQWDNTDVGYVVSNCGFDAEFINAGNGVDSYSTGSFTIEIPAVYAKGDGISGSSVDEDYIYNMRDIDTTLSTAKFKISRTIYANGTPIQSLILQDEYGEDLEWGMADVVSKTQGDRHQTRGNHLWDVYFEADYVSAVPLIYAVVAHAPYSVLEFSSKDFYPHASESDFEVTPGNKYQIKLEAKLVEGTKLTGLCATTYYETNYGQDVYTKDQQAVRDSFNLAKVKLDMPNADVSELAVTVRSKGWGKKDGNGKNLSRHDVCKPSDSVDIRATMERLDMSAWGILSDIMKRFRVEIYWDVQNSRFVFDPALERKGYNLPANDSISDNIDNNYPLKVNVNAKVPKKISFKNKDYGDVADEKLLDEFKPYGSYSGLAHIADTAEDDVELTSGEVSYELESALINKHLGGESQGAIFEDEEFFMEEGVVRNSFAEEKEIGIRVAFLKSDNVKRKILRSGWDVFRDSGRGEQRYKFWSHYNMGGVATNEYQGDRLDITRTEDGYPTGFYNYFSRQENVIGSFMPTLEGSVALPDSAIASNDIKSNYYKIDSSSNIRLSLINIDGALHNDNFLGDFKAIAYNRTTFFEEEISNMLDVAPGTLPSLQTASALNRAVKSIKEFNPDHWEAMVYFYVFAGETNMEYLNIKNVGTFDATVNGSLSNDHRGIYNGVVSGATATPNGWIDTNFSPFSDEIEASGDAWSDMCWGVGTGNNYRDNGAAMGVYDDRGFSQFKLNDRQGLVGLKQQVYMNSNIQASKDTFLDGGWKDGYHFMAANDDSSGHAKGYTDGNQSFEVPYVTVSESDMPDSNVTLFGVNDQRTGQNVIRNGYVGWIQYAWYGQFAGRGNFAEHMRKTMEDYIQTVGARKVRI